MKTRITMTSEHEGRQFETTWTIEPDRGLHVLQGVTLEHNATWHSFPSAVEAAGQDHEEYVQKNSL